MSRQSKPAFVAARDSLTRPILTVGQLKPVTAAEVVGWFRAVVSSRNPIPCESHVGELVSVLNGFWATQPTKDQVIEMLSQPGWGKAVPHIRAFTEACWEAHLALEAAANTLPANAWDGVSPAWGVLRAALHDLVEDSEVSALPVKRPLVGRPKGSHPVTCAHLAGVIARVLRLAGWKQVSSTSDDGPVAKIGVKALDRAIKLSMEPASFADSVRRYRGELAKRKHRGEVSDLSPKPARTES